MHGVAGVLRGTFQGEGRSGLAWVGRGGERVNCGRFLNTTENRPGKQPREFTKLTHAAPRDSPLSCCQAYFDNPYVINPAETT